MADIANQLEGAIEGLDRFLEALDNSSMKLGSNAAVESKLARAAQKKADQDLRFRKKIEKMEKETVKREAAHLAQLKAMEPFRKRAFSTLKQEIKSKTDLIKQTKGLGDVLKKTGAGLGSMFKSLGSGISKAMSGLGAGFKGGIAAGLSGIWDNLKKIEIAGFSVGRMLGAITAGAKLLYDVMSTHEKLMNDITKQTGIMGKTFKEQYRKEIIRAYQDLGKYGYELKEVVKLTQDMREAFGDVSYVTREMVKTSAELQMVYRMSSENANELVEAMTRSGYESKEFLDTMQKTAIVMGADVGMAMRDVAKNTQMMELYAGRGEEYFARMASRAALLGTNMQSIEDSGKAFEDFEQMAENMGVMSQLFGAGFADGLKSLTDMRMMYERGDMLGLQEHIAEQTAKTLYYEKGILKSRKTGDILYQSQIKQMATTMGMDNVSALRAIKSAKMQEMWKTKEFEISQKTLKAAGASAAQQELFQASEFDHSMAMFSALREKKKLISDEVRAQEDYKNEQGEQIKKGQLLQAAVYERVYTEEKIAELLSKQGEQGKKNREKLLAAAVEEMKKRELINEEQGTMEEKTFAIMSRLDITMAALNTTMGTMFVGIGKGLENEMGGVIDKITETTTGFFNGLTEGMNNWVEGGDITDNIEMVATEGVKGGIIAGWDNITAADLKGKGMTEAISMAMKDSLGAAKGQSLGSIIAEQFVDGMVSSYTKIAKLFARVLQHAWDSLDILFDKDSGKFTPSAADVEELADRGIDVNTGMAGLGTGGVTKEALRLQKELERKIITDTGEKILIDMTDEQIRQRSAEILQQRQSRLALEKESKNIDLEALGPIDIGTRRALGWAGGRHRGIVGEAGTEVGITKSALRELASAGIPGYANGFVGAATNTQGFYTQAGGVPERSRRQAASRAAGEEYRERIRRTEQAFLKIEYNTGQLEKGQPWWVKTIAIGLKNKGIMDSILNKIASTQDDLLAEDRKQTFLTKSGNALLGGIGSGLDAMSRVLQAGGTGKQAKEMARRGLIGGFVKTLADSFGGTADVDYLSKQAQLGAAFAATGRVFTGPTLAMVGEGGANEVVIPTERIRKGLPINAGVAKELASIGVPGFQLGIKIPEYSPNAPVDLTPRLGIGIGARRSRGEEIDLGPSRLDKLGGGLKNAFTQNWQSGVSTAGLSFAQSYMATGDAGYSAGQAAGSAIGFGIQMGLSAIPIPGMAIVGAIAGPLIGGWLGKKLGKKFMYKPKYEKHQKRALKNTEDMVSSGGLFMHGQPPGIKSQIDKGMLGSRKKHPSDEEREKMIKMFATSPVLSYGFGPGNSASQLLGLLAGQVGSTQDELSMYKRYNNAFYGTPMAKGGIVTGPTNAVIGEAGPEAVIPLNKFNDYSGIDQMKDNQNIITELRKQNQQMQMFIKNMGDAKTVLNVDGKVLAETVGQNMYDITTGMG